MHKTFLVFLDNRDEKWYYRAGPNEETEPMLAKPVVHIHHLPRWPEGRLRAFREGLVNELKKVKGLFVNTEADVIILCPRDELDSKNVLVRVEIPRTVQMPGTNVDTLPAVVGEYLVSVLPGTYVQVRLSTFSSEEVWYPDR